MTLILKQIFAFLKLLNSETGTHQIAWGIALGFVLGMTPALSLQTLLVFLLIFIFRVQAGAAFLSAFFFKFAAYLLDPLFHIVGEKVLQTPSLQDVFTTLYNMPIIPLTRFNNTIVMGSGVVSLLLVPVIYVLAKIFVIKYRHLVVERFQQSKIWKAIKATSLYKWYYKYDSLYG
ncbi:MAG: TIGR03546 family protein [Pseudobdellovibrionaceae bacterium]|nr:TIGR03546 family protein [Bdellovibrionales bacterium]USN46248.1 MAG: TIGR03546 family protein [Pseudobdellovibrionaceae bacterium]